MNDKTKFGLFLTNQRQCHSMRSQELAEELGIFVGYLSQLEHGQRTNPNMGLVESFVSHNNLAYEKHGLSITNRTQSSE